MNYFLKKKLNVLKSSLKIISLKKKKEKELTLIIISRYFIIVEIYFNKTIKESSMT